MKRPFVIKEIKPNIFLFEFTNHYDICMYFLRYQEFYESSSPKFRGKSFQIIDFMKWYSLKYGKGAFTYPMDWDGFNIPGEIIGNVWKLGISDKNIYDYEMYKAWKEYKVKAKGKFYIIGIVRGNKESNALNHEIAHALFYLNSGYKAVATALVKDLPVNLRKSMNLSLKILGYTPKVYVDETQAYLATGLSEGFDEKLFSSEVIKPFAGLFQRVNKK